MEEQAEVVTPLQLDDSEQNTDWVKTSENRETEAAIHQEIGKEVAAIEP